MRARALATVIALAACPVLPVSVRAAYAQDATSAATAPIATLSQALTTMVASTGGFAAQAKIVGPAVDAALDLETILRNSVGLRWATVPAQQQQQLLSVFRSFTIANYVSNFTGSGDRFAVAPGTRQAGADVVVGSTITPPTGDPTRIDYVMRQSSSGWKAVDVLVDGTISRVAVQRSDFRSVLDDGGAPALIQSLRRKVSTLSDGQMQP